MQPWLKSVGVGVLPALLWTGSAHANEVVKYEYDQLGRLVRVTTEGTAATAGQTVDTSFDPAGNRVQRVVSGTTVPVISVTNSPSTNEGGSLVFTIAASPAPAVPISVSYSTADNTAFANVNYTPTSGLVTLTPSQPSQTVTVATINDLASTPDLAVSFNLSAPTSGAALGTASGVGSIININPASVISITNSPSVSEGGVLSFSVTASPVPSSPITVSYATFNDTAVAPTNYITKSGTLTLTPAQPTQAVNVTTVNDLVVTGDLLMSLNLTSPGGGATLGVANAYGTVVNTNLPSTISITNTPSIVEGGTLSFTVVASPAPSSPITVSYVTADGTATAPVNYAATSGILTLTPAQPSQTVTVNTMNDGLTTGDLTMSLSLATPTGGASLGTANATGTIANKAPLVIVTPFNSYTLIVIP